MMETRLIGRAARMLLGLSMVAGLLLGTAAPVAAHAHFAANGQAGDRQVLADGQNHPRFLPNGDGTYTSCESNGPLPGSSIGNAWYGLETAHHGPDSGDPGKGDGCYAADSSPSGEGDDVNPAID